VFIDAVLGYRRPALATLSLGGYLLLSTVFRVHSMLPNMEINEK
jgi:hypothetical protein